MSALRLTLALLFALMAPTPGFAASLRLAVLPFTNASADPEHEPLGKGLQSMITTDLIGLPDTDLVERSRIQAVLSELALQRTGALDPESVVAVGKLTGATHLLDGSLTVSAGTMRLDARLVHIETGKVTLATQVSGERDAFFELEKDLVRQLVGALGLNLAPKERAAMRRIHTADWAAFEDFSRGIDLYDHERYADAITALQTAIGRDEDFKLARVTSEQYASLLHAIALKRQAVQVAKEESARLKKSQALAEETAILQDLLTSAALEGEAHHRERLAAVYSLMWVYDGRYLPTITRGLDPFHAERTASLFAWRYYLAARPDFPNRPPYASVGSQRMLRVGKEQAYFDELDALLFTPKPERVFRAATQILSERRLPMDDHQRIAAHVELMKLAQAHGAEDETLERYQRDLAHRAGRAGLYSQSTRAWAAVADLRPDHAATLAQVEKSIAENQSYEAAIAASSDPDLSAEFLMLRALQPRTYFGRMPAHEFAQAHAGERSAMGLSALWRLRALSTLGNRRIAVGSTWLQSIRGSGSLYVSGRSDLHRGSALVRYYTADRGALRDTVTWHPNSLVILGEAPHDALSLSLSLHLDPTDDFWPRQARATPTSNGPPTIHDETPSVTLLVGVRDVRTHNVSMSGWAITITRDEISLAPVVSTESSGRGKPALGEPTERVERLDKKRGKVELRLEVEHDGNTVLFLNKKAHALRIPGYESGYLGLFFFDEGYCRIEDLVIDG